MTRTNLTDRDLYLNRQNFYVASFSIVTSLFGLFFHISSGYRQAELSVLTEHIRQNYLLAMQRQEMDTEVMRMYHDIKNQLIGIAGTDDGAVRRVRAERLLEQVKGFERIAYSGNSVLDALLNSKAEKAAGQQTTLNLFIEKNEYFCLDSMDLCSIIGNALDNALEAVAMLKPDERTVNMKMAVVKGVLVIKVENPYQGELQMENNRLLSRKPGPHHGIGLSSIQYSTEKNGGKMQLDICEQKFSLKIMIPAGEPPVPR